MECDPIYSNDKLPVGAIAEGFPAVHDGATDFYRLRDSGLPDSINGGIGCCDTSGDGLCNQKPTATIIDIQSVRTTEASSPGDCDTKKRRVFSCADFWV